MRCVLLLSIVFTVHAWLPLPSYIKPCSRNDPNLDQCALEHGRAAIPYLVKGDRKYKIPVLDPFEVTEIKILDKGPRSAMLKLTVRDAKLIGLKDIQLESIHIDITEGEVTSYAEAWADKIEILSHYDIVGNILVLPIRGNGLSNITMIKPRVSMKTEFNFQEIDGRTHLLMKNFSLPINAERMQVNLTNLFNGNKLLGREMNEFLNNNWREVYKELGPTLLKAFQGVVMPLFNSISTLVPYDQVFPEHVPNK